MRLYAANFLTKETVAGGYNLCQVKFDASCDESLGIVVKLGLALEGRDSIQPLFVAMRIFCTNSTKMLSNFPFNDSLMKDLSVPSSFSLAEG